MYIRIVPANKHTDDIQYPTDFAALVEGLKAAVQRDPALKGIQFDATGIWGQAPATALADAFFEVQKNLPTDFVIIGTDHEGSPISIDRHGLHELPEAAANTLKGVHEGVQQSDLSLEEFRELLESEADEIEFHNGIVSAYGDGHRTPEVSFAYVGYGSGDILHIGGVDLDALYAGLDDDGMGM